MKKIILIIVISTSVLIPQSAGNSGLSFLKFGFGARNVAMGDAGNAAANDVTALFYNPSRLSGLEGTEILVMHNEWIQDIRSEVIGIRTLIFGLPFAFGANVTTISDIEVRSKPGEPEAMFDANYFFGSISTGFEVYENFSAGLSVKYLYEGIFVDEAFGWGIDFGIHYKTNIEGLTASAVVRNIGSMGKLRIEKTKLPTEIRIGPAYQFDLSETKFDLLAAAELLKYTATDDIHFNLGAEIIYDNVIALRGGYQSGYDSKNFTTGLGLIWGGLRFDYAFQPFKYGLGSASLFSLQFRF